MMELFIACCMGHLVGDYLLQNNWMALNKAKRAEVCMVHVTVYTLVIFAFLLPEVGWSANLGIFLGITWVTHFIQDHFNIVGYWTRFIGGRDLYKYCEDVDGQITVDGKTILTGGFTSLVYTVCDNAYHLLWFYVPLKMGLLG